ncbi:VAMP-associated protein [Coniochaeta hoffmannii]|uniref:VAMP-associated protein n=1 Tax=Coniochaeta hoffmannii TaxID=91930 RepID=A0AA38VGB2_9PEZI|nr:VAMP-associated protein [Coniochaeta hoffmannii]
MSVEIDPLELGFRRPFTEEEVGQILKIKNSNPDPVAFKVKTTAPKQYCVRPNSGRIEPGHEVEVTVLLQAMKTEPPLDARCRDKFLVQSVSITGDKVFDNIQQIWDSVEKSAIQERKIRVNWLPAFNQENGNPNPAVTPVRNSLANGVEATPDAPPPAYSSPSENNTLAGSKGALKGDVPIKREPDSEERDIKHQPDEAATLAQSTINTVKSTAGAAYEGLKDQAANVEAKVSALTSDATSGLRQRKTGAADPAEAGAVPPVRDLARATRQGTEGVPIQIVAVLCLLSFLLGYLFF